MTHMSTSRVIFVCFVCLIATIIFAPTAARAQDTPAMTIETWQAAITLMDIGAYQSVLSDTYRFVNSAASPYPEDIMGRDQDLISTANLFSGRQFEDSYSGNIMGPILSITIPTLTQLTDWALTPPEHPRFPGTQSALYDLYMILYESELTIRITGQIIFYVAETPITASGRANEDPVYVIEGLRDLTGETRNEDVTLTSIKWIYANAIVGNESSSWSRMKMLYADQ